jgi:hypothetical protein
VRTFFVQELGRVEAMIPLKEARFRSGGCVKNETVVMYGVFCCFACRVGFINTIVWEVVFFFFFFLFFFFFFFHL